MYILHVVSPCSYILPGSPNWYSAVGVGVGVWGGVGRGGGDVFVCYC